jgi:hypothetical protein
MKLSLIDWVLLSRTSLIIASYQSSFSEEAAVAGNIPRVQIRNAGHVLGHDVSQPWCRYPYDRGVGTQSVYNPCKAFTQAWGIQGVYC